MSQTHEKKIRWGLIGLGWFGEVHAEALSTMPGIELAALCTRRPQRLAEVADRFHVAKRYTDYHDLLADPDIDVVGVTTHIYDHRDIAIDALAQRQARVPGKADGADGRRLRPDSRGGQPSAGQLHGRSHLPVRSPCGLGQTGDRRGADRQDRLDARPPQSVRQDRPDGAGRHFRFDGRRHPRRRFDALVQRSETGQRLRARDPPGPQQVPGRRLGHGPLGQRRDRRDRVHLALAGEHAVPDRCADGSDRHRRLRCTSTAAKRVWRSTTAPATTCPTRFTGRTSSASGSASSGRSCVTLPTASPRAAARTASRRRNLAPPSPCWRPPSNHPKRERWCGFRPVRQIV